MNANVGKSVDFHEPGTVITDPDGNPIGVTADRTVKETMTPLIITRAILDAAGLAEGAQCPHRRLNPIRPAPPRMSRAELKPPPGGAACATFNANATPSPHRWRPNTTTSPTNSSPPTTSSPRPYGRCVTHPNSSTTPADPTRPIQAAVLRARDEFGISPPKRPTIDGLRSGAMSPQPPPRGLSRSVRTTRQVTLVDSKKFQPKEKSVMEHAEQPVEGDSPTADLEQAAPTEDAVTDSPDDVAEEANPCDREAAKWRKQLRAAEAERDTLAAKVEALQRAQAEDLITRNGVKPAAVFAVTSLADLLDDSGAVRQHESRRRGTHGEEDAGHRRRITRPGGGQKPEHERWRHIHHSVQTPGAALN